MKFIDVPINACISILSFDNYIYQKINKLECIIIRIHITRDKNTNDFSVQYIPTGIIRSFKGFEEINFNVISYNTLNRYKYKN